MSRSTTCMTVPFAIRGEHLTRLFSSLRSQYEEDGGDGIIPIQNSGWNFHIDKCKEYTQRRKTLYCNTVDKAGNILFVVNEAEWSNAGDESYCVFSDCPDMLNEFLADCNLNASVTNNESVQQTL
jgi:hypothetical protein